ncbi:MAG: hypothetical protein HYZ19_01475 [Rhodocyclales bacterium]|nr:hypothetical protein [Rhodocyclales bacterium]
MFTVFQILMLVDGFFMWSLIGQGLLGLLIGRNRHNNFFYKFLSQVTRPAIVATRFIVPKAVGNEYMGFIAVGLLVLLRFALYFVWYANGWIPLGVSDVPVQ